MYVCLLSLTMALTTARSNLPTLLKYITMSDPEFRECLGERIFSYLTALDTPQRRSMDVDTLTMILFLRANWRIVELLRIDLAALITAVEAPPDRGAAEAARG